MALHWALHWRWCCGVSVADPNSIPEQVQAAMRYCNQPVADYIDQLKKENERLRFLLGEQDDLLQTAPWLCEQAKKQGETS